MKKSANKINGKDFIIKNRVLIGVGMIVAAVVFGLLLLPKAVSSAETKYEVYVATQDIPAGTKLTEDMYEIKKITDADVASNCYQSTDNIEGFETVAEIKKDEALTKEAFGNKTPANAEVNNKPSLDKVPDQKQLIGVKIPSLSAGVSFGLKPGDVIRFYSTREVTGTKLKESYTPYELQFVEVFGVYDSSGMECEKSGGAPASLTLIVTQEQAKRIVEIISNSDTYFSLMSSGDPQKKETILKYQDSVLSSKPVVPAPEQETTTIKTDEN